jgi:hypothetical protein
VKARTGLAALLGIYLTSGDAAASIIGLYRHVPGRDQIELALNTKGEPILRVADDFYPAAPECSTGYQSFRSEKDRPKKEKRIEFDEEHFKGQMSIGIFYSPACLQALSSGPELGKPPPTRRLIQEINLYDELKLFFTDAAFKTIVDRFKFGRLELGVSVQASWDCYDTSEFERTASFREVSRKAKILVGRSEVVFPGAAECGGDR